MSHKSGSPDEAITRRAMFERAAAGSLAVAAVPAQAAAQSPLSINEASAALTLQAGTFAVDANITVKADMLLLPGARIAVAKGRTLTVLGDFQAPVGHVFIGPGTVDLNRSRAPAAHPEWWGATPDSPAVDCLPALRACIAAHPVTILRAADYHISATLVIDRPFRRIWGAGYRSNGSNQGTRIIIGNGLSDVVQVGTASKPPTVNDFLQGIDMRWIELARSTPAAPPTRDAAAGLRVRFVLFCHFESLSAREHANGFSIIGAVRTHFRDCVAFRSLLPRGGGAGTFRGFHLDGRVEIGLAGGNASVYLTDCNATVGGKPKLAEAVGLLLEGAYADSFISNFETSEIPVGIRVAGNARGLSAARRRSGHANLHISMPVIDQCSNVGIDISDTSDHSLIEIHDPYVALAPGALAGIFLHSLKGLTSIIGGQIIGWVDAGAGGNGLGIHALDAEGFEVTGTKLLSMKRPAGLDRCRNFELAVAVNNPDVSASQAAIWLRDCVRAVVRVRVKGRAGAFPQGAYLAGGGNREISIDATGVDPAAIAGGSANRVVVETQQVPVPGRLGSIEVHGPGR